MRELLRRLSYAIRQRTLDAELAEEIEFHRAMTQRRLEASGLDAGDADAEARRALGSRALAMDRARDVWVPRWLHGLSQDLRLARRLLWNARLASAVAVLSLALGIGANTAAFSLVNSLLLKPLPVQDPGRLALLIEPARAGDSDDFSGVPMPVRYAVWDEIRRRPALFENALAWGSASLSLGAGGEAQAIDGLWASDGFFEVLGVGPFAGRTFSGTDATRAESRDVAVISYSFWQRHFGGAADAIGQRLNIESVLFTVVGVTPPAFFGPEVGRRFDVIVPLSAEPRVHGKESWLAPDNLASPLRVVVRLRQGQTAEAASAALRGMQPQIRTATLPASWPPQFAKQYLNDPLTFARVGDASTVLRRRYGRPLLTIMVVVMLVLLIACGNVANLLLARATARRHDLGVRRALGASRWRLARQLIIESASLAAIAATLGTLFASWASRMLVYRLSTDANPIYLDVALDVRLLIFAVGVTVATVLLCGVLPAYRASGIGPSDALRSHGRASADPRARAASGLVVAQVALSFVLIVMSGLLVRSFTALSTRPLGFDPNHVLLVTMSDRHAAIEPAQRAAIYERAREGVRRVPGVAAAGLAALTPIVTGPMFGQPIKQVSGGPPVPPRGENSLTTLNLISGGWFSTLGMPLVGGRDVSDQDRIGSTPVAVVNQAFARKFLDGVNPIGHTVTVFLPGPPPPPIEIVGLVADAVYGTLRYPAPATMYMPMAQLSDVALPFLSTVNLTVRTAEPPALLTRSIAAAIGRVNPDLSLKFQTLTDQLDSSLTQERVLALLSGFFGGVALLLAALGLYGVTTYAVARRRTEIGIRMALGATAASIMWDVLRRVSVHVAAGVMLGTIVSLWATRFVAALLYGLEPHDPATLAGSACGLAAVAALAAWLPARRAARLDPNVALRSE